MLKGILVGRARGVIPQYRQFEAEARKDGARFIEAEHMLLALAASDTDAGRLLNEAGLDHERLAAALRDERRQSLAFAGLDLPVASVIAAADLNRGITLGTSAKEAVRRGIRACHAERSRHRRLDSLNLLVGILQAELGTVPRALAIAGIDRSSIVARARAAAGAAVPPC